MGNQRAVLDLLLEGMLVDTPDEHGQTMLMFASRDGDTSMAEFLLSQGADVNARDAYTRSCLHHAAGTGNASVVRLLVSAGAMADYNTERGHTSLHFACRSTDINAIDALVSLKADIHAVTTKGDTTIHQAVRSIEYSSWMVRMPDAVERLIAAGVNPKLCNAEGKSAFDLAERWLTVFAHDRHRVVVLCKVRDLFAQHLP